MQTFIPQKFYIVLCNWPDGETTVAEKMHATASDAVSTATDCDCDWRIWELNTAHGLPEVTFDVTEDAVHEYNRAAKWRDPVFSTRQEREEYEEECAAAWEDRQRHIRQESRTDIFV